MAGRIAWRKKEVGRSDECGEGGVEEDRKRGRDGWREGGRKQLI